MKITLGLKLDGETPPFPENTVGSLRTGPAGLLQVLETRLGLGGIFVDMAVRIAQYRAALILADNGRRFFSRSLAVDPLAVAKTLLGWRDLWLMADWHPGHSRPSSIKIHDLFEVEAFAEEMLAAGEPERWKSVLKALATCDPKLDSITCVDPLSHFPGLVRAALEHLRAHYTKPDFLDQALGMKNSDLWKIQSALLQGKPRCEALSHDGSVTVLTGSSDRCLAYGAANFLKNNSRLGNTIILSSSGTASLDDGLHAIGLPRTSAGTTTPYRPASQVTRMCLALFWEPRNPFRMLELLTHPVSPIHRYISKQLAQAVAKSPGVGGSEWLTCIEKLKQWVEIRRADGKSAYDIDALIQTWLVPPTFDPLAGGEIAVFIKHCDGLTEWSAMHARLSENSPTKRQNFLIVYRDALSTKQVLTEYLASGKTLITAVELDQVLDETTGNGASRFDSFAELGHVPVVKSPEAVVDRADTVLWWDFLRPKTPKLWPAFQAQLAELQEQRAQIPSTKEILSQQSRSWLRPILAATERVILCIPDRIAGEEVFAHPLWDNLLAMTASTGIVRQSCDTFLKNPDEIPAEQTLVTLEHKPLPPLQRWWQIENSDLLTSRAHESFTSIEAFLKSPYKWVLQYKARLSTPSILAIPEGDTLKGKLSHRVLECLFASQEIDWRSIDDSKLKIWINQTLAKLMSEEGANLLLPGLRREVEGLRLTIFAAAAALLTHLREAKVESVTMELPIQGAMFKGMELHGFIDLLATNAAKREAVIDLKWGGKAYRTGILKENQQLQLAIYSAARMQVSQKWPSDGFFIIREKSMLTQDSKFFPSANVIRQMGDVTSMDLWQAVDKCWDWRRLQLDKGLVEITVTGTTADENSENPVEGIVIPETDDRYNDYRTLTGWRDA